MFIAENHFKALVGKGFVGLGSSGAADHVHRKRFEHLDKRLADLQARRNHEGANMALHGRCTAMFAIQSAGGQNGYLVGDRYQNLYWCEIPRTSLITLRDSWCNTAIPAYPAPAKELGQQPSAKEGGESWTAALLLNETGNRLKCGQGQL